MQTSKLISCEIPDAFIRNVKILYKPNDLHGPR